MSFPTTLAALGLNLAAIFTLAYAIYFRRHRRRDLLGAYVALNLGVFCAVTLLAAQEVGVALGFGLFGILSIVRLRSSSITQQEVGYYFVALTLGLVNGLGFGSLAVSAVLDVVLLAGMYVADHPRVAARVERRSVLLDTVHADPVALHADLERRLGGEVLRCVVTDVDYVQGTTSCDVRFRAPRPPTVAERAADGAPASAPPSVEQQSVLLDTVHRDRVALGADLERRLGGEVLGCAVTEVDYVQGTTRCDVRLRPAGPARETERAATSRAAAPDRAPDRHLDAVPAGGVR